MSNKAISSTVAIVGGLGIGALAMYLLDPKQGEKRRSEIASTASSAVSTTRDAAEATLGHVSKSARSATGKAAHYARDLADRVIDEVESRAHDLAGTASDVAHTTVSGAAAGTRRLAKVGSHATDALSKALSRYSGQAQDTAEDLRAELAARVRRAAGVKESHPVAEWTGHTLGTFGFLVIGAGTMYFLDPARGRSRRAWLEDKVVSIVHRTGKRARGLGRHLSNRTQGYVAEASHALPEPWKPSFMREGNGAGQQASMPVAPQAK